MLKLNCLINDTQVAEDIKNAIRQLVGDRLSNNQSVTFPPVYNQLRKEGLEVDAESAGALYNDLYGHYNDSALSSESQIREFSGKDVVDQQKAIVDAMEGTQVVKENQIGKLPPEKQVATMIAKMFQEATFDVPKNVNSVMKQMETLVARAAKALLPPNKRGQTKGLHENLKDFFDTEKVQFQTLRGGVNTLETLHSAVKDEVDSYLAEITQNMSDEDAQEFTDKWEAYTNAFIQSTYDIMLGKSDQNKLVNEALKQVKIEGKHIVDVNGNIKWKTLMEEGNPDTISEGVKKLFEDGIKDEQGNVQKYSREEASRIGDYFEGLYKTKLAAVKQQKIGNERSKNLSSKNIISDFIKDQGFVNLAKDKDGKLLITKANWEDALKEVSKQVGAETGMDVIVQKLEKYLGGVKNPDGTNKYNDRQVDIITNDFKQTVAAKLVPGTAVPHAMARLIALKNLNHGRSFEKGTESALNNVLGVGDVDQKVIDSIKTLVEAADNIMNGNNVDGKASEDIVTNRGAYAYQALSQIERKIKEIIRENRISKSQTQRIVKYIGDTMGAASTSLLINPKNFLENIITGISSNVAESFLLLATNPKLFGQLGGAQKNFWTAFASHASGGVANEVINETDLSTDLQAGERLRLNSAKSELKQGRALSFLAKVPAYAASIFSRTFMNSVDAGFNSALLRKKLVGSVYNALKEQGFSGSETINLMDDALNVSDEDNAELDKQNQEIKQVLNSVGIYPTAADMAQNKIDLKLGFYEDALQNAAKEKGYNISKKQVTEATKALVESAALQAKVLGGKKEIPSGILDFVNRAIYGSAKIFLTPQREGFKSQQKLEESGDLKKAAFSQFTAELVKNTAGRFAGGIANFLALATTATPLGLLTAASLRKQRNLSLKDNPNAANIFKGEPGDIRRYAEYHNLMRSMVARSLMGTTAILGFIAKKLLDDDDDEKDNSWIDNLMQTKSGRQMINKFLPMGVVIAANIMYDVKDKRLDSKMERMLNALGEITGRSYDSWSSLKSSLNKAKTGEDEKEALAKFFGNQLPTFNINQGEQLERFLTTLQSATDRKHIRDVKKDEAIAKKVYKDTEDWIDGLLINGSIDAIRRMASEKEQYNRFRDKK